MGIAGIAVSYNWSYFQHSDANYMDFLWLQTQQLPWKLMAKEQWRYSVPRVSLQNKIDSSHLDSRSHQKWKSNVKLKTYQNMLFQAQAFCAKERVKNKEIWRYDEICTTSSSKLNRAQVETGTLVADQKAGIQPPCCAKAWKHTSLSQKDIEMHW